MKPNKYAFFRHITLLFILFLSISFTLMRCSSAKNPSLKAPPDMRERPKDRNGSMIDVPNEYIRNRVAFYNTTDRGVLIKIGISLDDLQIVKIRGYDNYVTEEYLVSPIVSIQTGNQKPRISKCTRGYTYHIVWVDASKCFNIE